MLYVIKEKCNRWIKKIHIKYLRVDVYGEGGRMGIREWKSKLAITKEGVGITKSCQYNF